MSRITLSVVTAAYQPDAEWLNAAGESIAATAAASVDIEWLVRFDGVAEVPGWFRGPAGLVTRASTNDGQRHGIAATRNLALATAVGEFVAGCDHDDLWEPAGMAAVIAAARTAGTWAAGRALDVDPTGRVISAGPEDPFPPGLVARGEVLDAWERLGWFPFWCNAAVVATPLWRAVGGWTALPRSDDLASWATVSELAAGRWVPEVAYRWRRHPSQTTVQDWYLRARDEAWSAVRARVCALRSLEVRTGSSDDAAGA